MRKRPDTRKRRVLRTCIVVESAPCSCLPPSSLHVRRIAWDANSPPDRLQFVRASLQPHGDRARNHIDRHDKFPSFVRDHNTLDIVQRAAANANPFALTKIRVWHQRHSGCQQLSYGLDFGISDRQCMAAGADKIDYTPVAQDCLTNFWGICGADENVAGKERNIDLLLAVTPLVSFLEKR